jgi:predicted amidohydrolase YtcJ
MCDKRQFELTRRDFLKSAGLGLGTLLGAGLACGRTAQGPAPTATPLPGPPPTAVSGVTNPPSASAMPPPATVPALPPELAADLVLFDGKVITVDPAGTIAQAVAVKDGRIQAVGTDAEVRALATPATRTIDLDGRALTPGLVDAHNHLQVMGLLGSYYLPLLPPEVRTLDDLRAKLAETLARTPEGEWVQGYFLVVSEGRLPTRHDLDPVSPRHPVWIVQQGGHYGSANSLALQVAGITAATPDPEGGVIERDSGGEPTGVFYNHRAMDLLRQYIPRYTPEATRRMADLGVVVSTQPQFLRLGGDAYPGLFGAERARRAIVTREWLEAGVPLALGSDSPTTPWYTPQVTLFGAVSRITMSGQVYEPDQALTVQEALRAHTLGSAYAAHEEEIKGSVEAGKLADLAVWSEDPYTAPLQRLWQIPVDLTLVGGKVVYQRVDQ